MFTPAFGKELDIGCRMFCIALSSDVVMRAVCLHFVIICGESLIMRRCGEAAEAALRHKESGASKK